MTISAAIAPPQNAAFAEAFVSDSNFSRFRLLMLISVSIWAIYISDERAEVVSPASTPQGNATILLTIY
jgi:hypothetical protein